MFFLHEVNSGRNTLFCIAAICAVVVALFFPRLASAQNQPVDAAKAPMFEVASVRLMQDREKLPLEQQMFYISPSGAAQFTARNITLTNLIGLAFGLSHVNQITGKPAWIDTTFYEIAAKPEGDATLSYEQLRPYLQQLLQERFHLVFHRKTEEVKGYALVTAKGEPKLKTSSGAAAHAYIMPSRIDAQNASTEAFASILGLSLKQEVVDKTGLKGNFDFRIDYAPTEAEDSSLPSIFTAIEEQLGLKLEKQMVPIEMFVIDHVDKVPTEN